MSQEMDNLRNPSPQEMGKLSMRQATAFAYGYSLTMLNATNHDHYRQQSENLKADLKLFGCFGEETGNLKDEYFSHFSKGSDAAAEELEGGYK